MLLEQHGITCYYIPFYCRTFDAGKRESPELNTKNS